MSALRFASHAALIVVFIAAATTLRADAVDLALPPVIKQPNADFLDSYKYVSEWPKPSSPWSCIVPPACGTGESAADCKKMLEAWKAACEKQ
ncbi:hypothetical protein DFR29_12623 [Tahibacter aquaticus]|uniref:Uncharacterized protein n=1 Tax=Tahibacter aquaticus TaxID=520092 RepID=A0A4R6YJ31_9GAMM|nr:hypothetical protein [Tahibacter aquaticus]TDR36987.1 hypothetical protein DFR29_12623 [Tahibacter aquaticus]